MHIWIINSFDELPGDTDIRHRYWALADTLSDLGHEVTWWSSDWSHRAKAYRTPKSCAFTRDAASFNIRLIHTSGYRSNVSLARLRNHRQFAKRFLHEALRSAEREGGPDRMVVSLPPLGTAQACFDIRAQHGGEVILDIQDAWPETFYRLFPAPLSLCAKILLSPLHKTAKAAYQNADRISAVSQTYIDLAKSNAPEKPTHLCYHGIDFENLGNLKEFGPSGPVEHEPTPNPQPGLKARTLSTPVKLVYIGALERSYDLETAIRAVHALKSEGIPAELHIAGAGSQEKQFKSLATNLFQYKFIPQDLRSSPTLFHGLLGKADLQTLLAQSHFGLIPMTQDSFVGIPYKLADYCAAALPVLSSLDGECRQLLDTKKAGSFYEPGSPESLMQSVKAYLQNPDLHSVHSQNALDVAQSLFDRSQTYPDLARFIVNRDKGD